MALKRDYTANVQILYDRNLSREIIERKSNLSYELFGSSELNKHLTFNSNINNDNIYHRNLWRCYVSHI